MDDFLRTSFARENDARRGARPAGSTQTPREDRNGNEPATLAPVQPPARCRARLSPQATVGLIALVLALTVGGVVYYATHATHTPARTYTPHQLYQAVSTTQPQVYDAVTAPDANGWDQGPMPGGACQYQSGAYHATALRTAVVQCLPERAPLLPSSGIVAVQVDLTFLTGDGDGGLVLCYAGLNTPYYRFVVKPSGYFDLFDPVSLSYVTSKVPLPPDAQYRLTAIVRTTGVYLYINEVFMVSGAIERGVSFAGQVRVFSVNGVHNPTYVVFHNFTMWSLTEPG